jgi:tetratricopeptide (TPR) repeat protein
VYPEATQAVLLTWLRAQKDDRSRAEVPRVAAKITQFWVREAGERARVGRFKGAIGAYREALRLDPQPATREQLREVIARQAELDDLTRSLRTAASPDATITILKKILDINPNSSFAHGDLGTLYSQTGKREEAIAHLEAVVKCEPSDAYGLMRLAEMAHREDRTAEAAALCARAYAINPVSPLNNNVWGSVLLKQERWSEAEKQFRKVLLSEPTDWRGNGGLSEALRHQGQAAEAVRFARRAVHWSNGQNAELLLVLADALTDAGRDTDARNALNQALSVAQTTNPALAAAIQKRVQGER